MSEAGSSALAGPLAAQNPAGTMMVVLGPSGAGKDTLMAYAARAFEGDGRVVFARRVITRPADAGGEQHQSVDRAAFERLESRGAFCVSWQAHGLCYGVPASALDDLAAGRVVVVNGSRSALSRFSAAVPSFRVALVTARREVLAERLAARGRETAVEVAERLARPARALPQDLHVSVIDNSGSLEAAGEAFAGVIAALLRRACRQARPSAPGS